MTDSPLAAQFHQAMLDGYQELAQLNYRATYFRQMVQEHGGVEAARRLLRQDNVAAGLTTLWEMGRLDLSVEALVLRPEYAELFTEAERASARQRLADLNFTAPWDQPATPVAQPAPSLVDRLSRAVRNTQGGGLDADPPAPITNPAPHAPRLYTPATLERLVERFKQHYSSFEDPRYTNDERFYKLHFAQRMRELLSRERLGDLLTQGDFAAAQTAIKQACSGSVVTPSGYRQQNNLLNQWDLRIILDAPAEPLARRLYDLLYGDGDFAERFDAWVAMLSTQKPGVWPAATYFLMLHDPEQFIFVKPRPFREALEELESDLPWTIQPDPATYAQLLDLAQELRRDLAPLGARDLIDVQSFLWRVGSPTDEPLDDEEPDEDEPLDRLDSWQAGIETASPFVRFFAEEYPNWLTATFGRRVTFLPYTAQRFSVYLDGQRIQWGRLRKRSGVFITLPTVREAADRERAQALGPQLALGISRGGTNFALENDADYAALQAIMRWIGGLPDKPLRPVDDDSHTPPDALDNPAFVVIHKSDYDAQAYGRSYQFSNHASGDSRKLIDALEAFTDGGPPVRFIIYRPGPHYAFTAWATSTGITRRTGDESNDRIYIVDLEQHEFTPPLLLKSAATDLAKRLSWLSDGLQSAFNFRSIRRITAADFATILAAAETPMTRPLTIADAAFTILSRAGGGPLHLSEVLRRIQADNLANLGGQTPQLTLASTMLRDERFQNLGKNTWVLATIEPDPDPAPDLIDLPEPPTRTPTIVADADARFWRIHLPRELWARARSAGVIAIGGTPDSANQSVKRFQQVAVGDRVVAYVQGGMIGGIGIVVRAFDAEQPRLGLPAATLGDDFTQYVRVAWADAPVDPVDLLAALRHPRYTDLYNRIKNPHTVIPLSRDDYVNLLSLLHVDDPGLPRAASRLPSAWTQLASYISLARALEARTMDTAQVLDAARMIDPPPAEPLDADDLVAELLQLRLIVADGPTHYRARPYVAGAETALLRLCALAVLVAAEGSADEYTLPARSILPQLRDPTATASAGAFAPELGPADSTTLAGWYAEAGLIDIDDDTWRSIPHALDPLPGDDPATTASNLFLATLQAGVDGVLTSDLAPVAVDAAVPEVDDLAERLRELGQELLFDTAVVRRVYRSLLAGRHVVLSGPPGTGKTELARRLPSLLWREAAQTFNRLTTSPEAPPVEQVMEQRHGYLPIVVTATEDWGVRDVVGGIGPRLDGDGGGLRYAIEHGALTRTVLRHYTETSDGDSLPAAAGFVRRDYRYEGRRYRGAWLVIDEFTRAPIDAAFGSLLTTLSGGEQARLAVPTATGALREVPLPSDFRIIGTLNSFDRHFLNQISEAMKRRFDFIDVLPPPPAYADFEQGIAVKEALRRIRASGFPAITTDGDPAVYRWPGVLRAEPVRDAAGLQRYHWHAESAEVAATLSSFWRLFSAVRVFRQLGTAQVIAVYLNLLTGIRVGMSWDEALDTALADALADQLQVLNRDEQRTIDAVVEHAGRATDFVTTVQKIVRELPPGRRAGYLYALRERDAALNGASDIAVGEDAPLTAEQITRVFAVAEPLNLPVLGIFRRRLQDLIGERGL